MRENEPPECVSFHGGHSGEFCNHAEDTLAEIVEAYFRNHFNRVGISEHMPPPDDRFLYPDEQEAGLDARKMYDRFARYVSVCRQLQAAWAGKMNIYVGFETEAYSGALSFVQKLIREFRPDYIVGSVHHVNDVPIDASPALYRNAADMSGGTDALYCDYFDRQYELIRVLRPPVVGHFDLIRIFDPDYPARLEKPEIQQRVRRNLELIRASGLILDFNMRALVKGATEPYVSRPILEQALELGIPVLPGDDSHSVGTVGLNVGKGIRILAEMGFDTCWQTPAFAPAQQGGHVCLCPPVP
ncbi:histidinol phosphatase [Desulfonema ishimotonii]|uniref:Histidinol-phosphatase n=1 Tax=Desulfonema ishimotonii TaxID=45657 RepID=A0A401FWB5_9BACT|nr:histidinol-phosphatase [Desulfonema ishimotonii]GBC61282.1 histidinol phosphatase [Desulfonema ishimotonii]